MTPPRSARRICERFRDRRDYAMSTPTAYPLAWPQDGGGA